MKEFRSSAFNTSPRFRYLPEKDRYLVKRDETPYRLNLIGAGIMGQEHMRIAHLAGRAVMHGVYDPNPLSVAAAQATHATFESDRELVVYDSLAAACNDPVVDGLIIATPNFTHLDVLQTAARSGKHILLEKPIATTVADSYAITQIAEAYPAVLQLGLQYRFKAIYQEAIHEIFERRSVGEVKSLSLLEHRIPFLDKVNQWNKFSRFSGDTLVEKCCHYFDLLNMFAGGRPQTVYASGSMAVNFHDFAYDGEKSDILDNALVIVNYDNGVRASFNLCMFAPYFYEELIVCGDEGHLKAWEREDFLPPASSGAGTHLELLHGEEKPSRQLIPAYPTHIQHSGHHGATYFEHHCFIDQIEGRSTPAATPQEGLWSIIVAAVAQEAIKRQEVINIDHFLAAHNIEI